MKNILFLLFILISISVSSQTKLIKGRITDSDTQDGIAYTNIGVEGTFYGTASDAEGFFELKIPDEFISEKLYVSAVGYQNITFQITELLKKEFNLIPMRAQSYDIESIDVTAQSRVLFRILKTASEKIPENYISGPVSMKMYYQEAVSPKDSGEAKTREALIELDDEKGYQTPSISDAFKSRAYRFTQVKRNFDSYSFISGSTGFDELLEMDIVRQSSNLLNTGLLNDYDLNLERTAIFEGDPVWIISYQTSKLDVAHTGDPYAQKLTGKIYINKTDYAILRNECIIEATKNSLQNRSLLTKNTDATDVKYHYTCTYKKDKGKYAPAYFDCDKTFTDREGIVQSSNKKASVLDISKDATKINGRDYFEDLDYADNFWRSFKRPF